jgi:hypothetical protein
MKNIAVYCTLLESILLDKSYGVSEINICKELYIFRNLNKISIHGKAFS